MLPRFFTLHTKCTFLPTKPVMFDGIVLSKYGPVPGVGNSCRKSVRKRFEPARQQPVNEQREKRLISFTVFEGIWEKEVTWKA